ILEPVDSGILVGSLGFVRTILKDLLSDLWGEQFRVQRELLIRRHGRPQTVSTRVLCVVLQNDLRELFRRDVCLTQRTSQTIDISPRLRVLLSLIKIRVVLQSINDSVTRVSTLYDTTYQIIRRDSVEEGTGRARLLDDLVSHPVSNVRGDPLQSVECRKSRISLIELSLSLILRELE